MLLIIHKTCGDVSNPIFRYYNTCEKDKNKKPIYDLLADSFLTLYGYTMLIFNHSWSQAFCLLRLAIEQVAKLSILLICDGACSDYVSLRKECYEYELMSKNEKKQFKKDKQIANSKTNDYFEYSWIKYYTKDGSYGRNQMLDLAQLNELKDDYKFLNKFVHGTLSIFELNKDNWSILNRFVTRYNLVCCKLYDYLCSYSRLFLLMNPLSFTMNQTFRTFRSIYEFVLTAKVDCSK